LVVARAPGLGAVVAESTDRQDDQARIDLGELLLGKPKAVKDSGAEVLHQHIGPADERPQSGAAGLLLEVQCH
jgi:hypothetical protein